MQSTLPMKHMVDATTNPQSPTSITSPPMSNSPELRDTQHSRLPTNPDVRNSHVSNADNSVVSRNIDQILLPEMPDDDGNDNYKTMVASYN